MDGYSVLATDDKQVGHVVGIQQDYYIVETRSALKKTRYPLPKRYASVEPERECVLMHMSKETLYGAPKVGRDGAIDEPAVAAYYGV